MSLILHMLNGVVFFFILKNCFAIKEKESFLLSLMFLVHPVNTQAVNLISAQGELLFSFFLLGAFYFYVKEKMGSAFVFFILSLLSKETAVIFLPLILLFDFCVGKGKEVKGWGTKCQRIFRGKRLILYLVLTSVIVIYFIGRKQLFGGFVAPHRQRPLGEDLFIAVRALFFYTGLWSVPYKLSLIHILGGFSLYELFGACAVIFATYYLARRRFCGRLVFGLGWFFIPILIVFFGSFSAPVAEHRLYWAGLGGVLFISALAENARYRNKVYILIALLFSLTLLRNTTWQNPFRLWQDTLAQYPASNIAHDNLAQEHYERGYAQQAIIHYERSLEIKPSEFKPYYNLGIIHGEQGEFGRAIEYFKAALEINPHYAQAYNNLGISYLGLKVPDTARAREAIERALKLGYPVNPAIRSKVGIE